jgi:hypothetical protein
MLFGYPVASSWMSCCGIPTRKLRIILMKFLVMCVSAINCENINVLHYIILFGLFGLQVVLATSSDTMHICNVMNILLDNFMPIISLCAYTSRML